MSLRRAKTLDEYVDWARQAVFEVDDLRACLEFELEDLKRFPVFLDPLEEGIKGLYQYMFDGYMFDGTYGFGRKDLPFKDLAVRFAKDIPFHTLRKQLDETHRRGLEMDLED
jgi:hypothetical protein